MKRFWAAPTGTGTAIRQQLNRIEAAATRTTISENTGLDQPVCDGHPNHDTPPTPDQTPASEAPTAPEAQSAPKQ